MTVQSPATGDRVPDLGEIRVTDGVIKLVVQGDDFGMCHAVNTGTVRAFREGVLTQASTMVPCPWFPEAAELALEHGLPLGIHQTLTCEWDYLRWGPLTDGKTLRGDDGFTMRRTVADASSSIDHDDAVTELTAQADRFLAAGLTIGYFDVHMGFIAGPAYETVSQRFGRPFLYPGVATSLTFTSIRGLSDREEQDKKPWLLHHIESLEPGVHLLVCHCATPGEEMSSITGPESIPFRWAEEYRKSDLAVLTDPDIRAAIEARNIELVSVAEAFA